MKGVSNATPATQGFFAPCLITVVEELENELCLLGGTSDYVGSHAVSRNIAALIGVHGSVS